METLAVASSQLAYKENIEADSSRVINDLCESVHALKGLFHFLLVSIFYNSDLVLLLLFVLL